MSPQPVREDRRRHFARAIPYLAHTIILADDDEFRATFAEGLRKFGTTMVASGR
jgi:hypothetical protein